MVQFYSLLRRLDGTQQLKLRLLKAFYIALKLFDVRFAGSSLPLLKFIVFSDGKSI